MCRVGAYSGAALLVKRKSLYMFRIYYSIVCTSSKGLKLWVFAYCQNSEKSCFLGSKIPEKKPILVENANVSIAFVLVGVT